MAVHWDRPWDSQGDEEREWSRELEERFEGGESSATEGDRSAATGDAEELAADVPEPDASEFDFTAGVELSRRPLGWNGKPKGRALIKPDEVRLAFSPHERLLILDTWQRSGLPAGDFAPLVGLSKHTLYLWKKRFAEHGPAGLAEQPDSATLRL